MIIRLPREQHQHISMWIYKISLTTTYNCSYFCLKIIFCRQINFEFYSHSIPLTSIGYIHTTCGGFHGICSYGSFIWNKYSLEIMNFMYNTQRWSVHMWQFKCNLQHSNSHFSLRCTWVWIILVHMKKPWLQSASNPSCPISTSYEYVVS